MQKNQLIRSPRTFALALLILFGLIAAACGGDDDDATSAGGEAPAAP